MDVLDLKSKVFYFSKSKLWPINLSEKSIIEENLIELLETNVPGSIQIFVRPLGKTTIKEKWFSLL